jgi:hypothetical protein
MKNEKMYFVVNESQGENYLFKEKDEALKLINEKIDDCDFNDDDDIKIYEVIKVSKVINKSKVSTEEIDEDDLDFED